MRRRYVINGKVHDLVVTRGANGVFHVSHGERKFEMQGKTLPDGRWRVTVDQRPQAVWIAAQGDSRFVHSAATGAGALASARPVMIIRASPARASW